MNSHDTFNPSMETFNPKDPINPKDPDPSDNLKPVDTLNHTENTAGLSSDTINEINYQAHSNEFSPENIENSNTKEFGPTSDYNGYGTDEKGYDIERNDLGPDYYNKQAHMGAEALYAAAEKEQEDEEKAAFPDWYGDKEDIEKAQHELLSEALTALRELRAVSEESQKRVNAEIEKVERIMATMGTTSKKEPQSTQPESPTSEATPIPPEADWTNPSVGAATITDTNAQNPAGAKSSERYVDSHGVSHSTREEAIAAEAGYR